MPALESCSELDVMALTVWAEARGESEEGQRAVAWVIKNRADDPGKDWWGDSIREVCLKKWQFSCWNENDPNRAQMLAMDPSHPQLARIRAICADVLAGRTGDPTAGCTHYCRPETKPTWKSGRTPDISIGHHDFYAIGTGA